MTCNFTFKKLNRTIDTFFYYYFVLLLLSLYFHFFIHSYTHCWCRSRWFLSFEIVVVIFDVVIVVVFTTCIFLPLLVYYYLILLIVLILLVSLISTPHPFQSLLLSSSLHRCQQTQQKRPFLLLLQNYCTSTCTTSNSLHSCFHGWNFLVAIDERNSVVLPL